ncbi:hypothetical protein TNCV_458661 [Trichonephila clavipes]|nr:hypothetical protein TNCV_458661 [Trichonephila clavipes]
MASRVPTFTKSSTSAQAHLLPSTSYITDTTSSESQTHIPLIDTAPATSNSLSEISPVRETTTTTYNVIPSTAYQCLPDTSDENMLMNDDEEAVEEVKDAGCPQLNTGSDFFTSYLTDLEGEIPPKIYLHSFLKFTFYTTKEKSHSLTNHDISGTIKTYRFEIWQVASLHGVDIS